MTCDGGPGIAARMIRFRLGTRGSPLALVQAGLVRDALAAGHGWRPDEIAVVEGGRVVERGTHDDLLAAGTRYAALYRTQYADAERLVGGAPAA